MRFKRVAMAVASIVLVTVMMIGISAGTASAESYDSPAPTVTFQAYDMTLWYSKSDVRSMWSLGFYGGAIAVIGTVCNKVPNWPAEAGCVAVIAVAATSITQTFNDAANAKQCVWVTLEYWGDLGGWGRYNC